MRSDVKVKKLVWSFSDNSVFCQWLAANRYCIKDTGSLWDHDRFWLRVAGMQAGTFATLEAAKAVAQADHEARVLAQPEPVEIGEPAVPEGWKLVPVEPTEAMHKAAEREWDGRMSARSRGVWQAMLAAAPSPEGKP